MKLSRNQPPQLPVLIETGDRRIQIATTYSHGSWGYSASKQLKGDLQRRFPNTPLSSEGLIVGDQFVGILYKPSIN
jgi:hypothetical protein